MKITQRDKKLVLVLPALALAIVYCLAVDRGLNARVRKLRQQVERAQATRASTGELVREEAQLAQAARDLTSVESETQKIRETLETVSDSAPSNKAPERVAALLPRHRLALIEQAMLTETPPEIGQPLQRFVAQSEGTNGAARAAFWRVKFVGTYPDTVAALDELEKSLPRVIPARLTMSDGPSKKAKMWTLVLWM